MGPIKEQLRCGSCWAFSTISIIEGAYSILTGQQPQFSEQQLVDCDTSNFGCNGGWAPGALDHIKTNGIAFAVDYPYKNAKGTCNTTAPRNKVLSSFESCDPCNLTSQMEMLASGPLWVVVDATAGFQNYKFGIIENTVCKKTNHAVVLIGNKNDNDGKGDYFVVRNSWGAAWGNFGNFFIRVQPSDNTCLISTMSFRSTVTTLPVPIPPIVKPSATLYTLQNYAGDSLVLYNSSLDLGSFKLKANSFKSNGMIKLGIFTKTNCTGSYVWDTKSFPSLYDKNNKVQSVVAQPNQPNFGCVWVWNNYCHTGDYREICKDIADMTTIGFNNSISSIQIGIGVKSVSVYLSVNFEGTDSSFSTDRFSYYGYETSYGSYDKKILSLKLVKA